MFRYLIDQLLIRTFDFFCEPLLAMPAVNETSNDDLHFVSRVDKRTAMNNSFKSAGNTAANNSSFADQLMLDLNNNAEESNANAETSDEHHVSKFTDDDWASGTSTKSATKSSFFMLDNYLRSNLQSSIDTYYDEINREFNFENLDKFYSADTKFKKRYFKMLTSYDKEEFLYTYLDNERDQELVKSLKTNITKAVKFFQKPYYNAAANSQQDETTATSLLPTWRNRERMKTVSVVLVVCLNVSAQPPGISKGADWSRTECWINHSTLNPQFAIKKIGMELQKQYQRWQPKALVKQCLDPTVDDVHRTCLALRKNAKDDRLLFHYNGHGVPPPTLNGQIWVYNAGITQYVTMPLQNLLVWCGTPSLFVWDCSNAGLIVHALVQLESELFSQGPDWGASSSNGGETVENTATETASSTTTSRSSLVDDASSLDGGGGGSARHESVHLAACRAHETLPVHPELPYDLFTACLTTPIKAALSWHITRKTLDQRRFANLTLELIDGIPGSYNDRRTMLGELNWILTAVTDTIAWNVLDNKLFHGLFRKDPLSDSLFRNFLLARRIMKSFDVNPVSHPALPETDKHPLWQSWDLTLDMCLEQLPGIIYENKDYVPCGFFAEQIELFDVWLKYNVDGSNLPEQLPILLQVLLNQQHRMRALHLLAKFLDLGTWAVSAALSVGIFPYILKLLTTQPELRPVLTFICAKILAVDRSCQVELVNEKAHIYFIHVLADQEGDAISKVYAAFVLACLVDSYPAGQAMALQNHLIGTCTFLVTDKKSKDYRNQHLRQWCCICLGLAWQYFAQAKWEAIDNNSHQVLIGLIFDPVPEVRAAAVFAVGTFISCEGYDFSTSTAAGPPGSFDLDVEIASILIREHEMAFVVRKELIIALYHFVYKLMIQSDPSGEVPPDDHQPSSSADIEGVFLRLWRFLVGLQSDPFAEVALLAQRVVSYFVERVHNFDPQYQRLIQQVMNGQDPREFRQVQVQVIQLDAAVESKSQSSSTLNELEPMKLPMDLVNWSRNFFAMPYLVQKIQPPSVQDSSIDIYAAEFLDQHCKVLHNHKVNRKPPTPWLEPQHMDELFQIKLNSLPLHCRFHSYDDQIFVVDKDSFIAVYDIPNMNSARKTLLRLRFPNDSNARSKSNLVTSFKLVNAQHEPMVLTGTHDCTVRLFKPDLMNYQGHTLLTAFRAFSQHERKPSSKETGLVAEWSDRNETLICAGDTLMIRVWDMNKELFKDYPTLADCCVSSLTFQDNLAVAGFGDGSVKVFDFRRPSSHSHHRASNNSAAAIRSPLPPPLNQPAHVHQHNAIVSKVFLHSSAQKLVTASIFGDIQVLDLRTMKPLLDAPFNNEPSWTTECHPTNQLVASANQSQSIKIYDLTGKELSVIKHHDGFIGKKISGVTCIDWNQFKNELAFGSMDNTVSIFTNKYN